MMTQRRWLIIAMLLSLHFALMSLPNDDLFSRVWLLVHFGLFLIWQPFVSGQRELNVIAVALLLGITLVILYTLAGGMFVAWIAILIAIMGGKVFTLQAAQRSRFYLVAVFYLFSILLSWTVPVSLLGVSSLPPGMRTLAALGLPLVMIAMVFLPFRAEDESTQQVFDFFYSMFVFQLVVVIVLGSLAAMRVTGNQYFPAVFLTVLSFAGALLLLTILWAPRGGFGGLRTYFSRYLMSVGMPFELWMRRIAELSETEMAPLRFLGSAMDEVRTLPWVVGAHWRSADGEGEFGHPGGHTATFKYHQLEVTFHTEIELSPALYLHVRLLAQVIAEFYEGKRRERVLRENAYMQAVHETGARLTHDIKNLLQSLYAITSASAASQERESVEASARGNSPASPSPFDSMLRRQLPQLTQRLNATLEKLRNPAVQRGDIVYPAGEWWRDIQQRYAGTGVTFVTPTELTGNVPANVFENALDNCIDNARRKQFREPNIAITVTLRAGDTPSLTVSDTGSAIPEATANALLGAPVPSARGSGLGIGLYQAARQARESGFQLKLERNEGGCVQFSLTRAAG
jgi:signal transduction histidine kinase